MRNIMHLDACIDFDVDIDEELEVEFMDAMFDLVEKYGGQCTACYRLYTEKEWIDK